MTCDLWPVTCDLWPATCDLWPATCDLRPVTCDLRFRPAVHKVLKPLFATIRHYSPLFATIRHYSYYSYYSLFATIRCSLFGFSRHRKQFCFRLLKFARTLRTALWEGLPAPPELFLGVWKTQIANSVDQGNCPVFTCLLPRFYSLLWPQAWMYLLFML